MEINYYFLFIYLLAIVANLSIVLFQNARILIIFPLLFPAGFFFLANPSPSPLFLVFTFCHFGSAKLSDDFWK